MRGSKQSELLKSEQHKISSLYKQRNELSKILNHIAQYGENHDHSQEFNNTDFPFGKDIQSLLTQILHNETIANKNYDIVDLLDLILSKSREALSHDNSIDKSGKFDSNIILNKSINNAINNLKNDFLDSKNYDSESILEVFFNNINNELTNNLEVANSGILTILNEGEFKNGSEVIKTKSKFLMADTNFFPKQPDDFDADKIYFQGINDLSNLLNLILEKYKTVADHEPIQGVYSEIEDELNSLTVTRSNLDN